MGDVASPFDAEEESSRGLIAPDCEGFRRLKAVVGSVDFDRLKSFCRVMELVPIGKVLWVEYASPRPVSPTRYADANAHVE